MTREKFIKLLEKEGISYKIEEDKIVVEWYLYKHLRLGFTNLKTLPPGVVFKNGGSVELNSLETLPPGVEFNNRGDVYLGSLKTIPLGVEFKNGGTVDLGSYLGSLNTLPGVFNEWTGNIKGISPNTLLNGMIKRGIFL